MRRTRRPIALGLFLLIAAGVGYWAFDEWRFRALSAEASRAVVQGRYPEAKVRLASLLGRRSGDGEALYQLGVCEAALGREPEALAAWAKVPAGSSFAGRAGVELARRELRTHRLARAEDLMRRAVGDSGPHAIEAIETLVTLYKIEGRTEEADRLVRASSDRYPNRIGLLRELAQLGSPNPHKLDLVRAGLETAAKASPDDDRVWLGRANFATRVGQFEEAARWLDRCQARRADDPAVWRGRLRLATETRDADGARDALRHLPEGELDPAEILTLRAWFAARAGDDPGESKALAALIAIEPADLRSIERLAELELKAGRPDEAARLRARKAEFDRSKAEYEIVLFLPDASLRSAQLAKLADALDRRLEAKVLWSMAVKQRVGDPEPIEALARIGKARPPSPPADATLAALLASLSKAPGPTAALLDKATPRAGAAAPRFVDEAEAAGLRFTFDNGVDPLRHLPETMSGGVGLIDFDGDGFLDLYCVQGGSFLPDPTRPTGGDRLFRNKGDGTFEDATASSKLDRMPRGYGHGVAVGDFDNDGRPDLLVTRWDAYALYRNKGDGTFEDATASAGLGGPRDWPTSAAFADLDNDGDLDLYVCHYLAWDVENPQVCLDPKKQTPVFCGPPKFKSRPDHLFRNDGGKFVDVTSEAGIVDTHGQGLGVVACDFDGDGLVDLFVANDQSANFLFRNKGGLKFEEIGEVCGVGSSSEGQYKANMGIALGDQDGDGKPDLAVTEFYNEGTTLYRNLGECAFADHSGDSGLQVASRYLLGFGTSFLDFDNDGRLDLATTNGHVDDFRPSEPYQMPGQLLAGTASGRLVDVTPGAGAAWQVPRLGRGLASGDLDNDGRIDLVILSQNQPLAFFRNKTEGGHRLTIRLEGVASNRDAVGSKVVVTAGGRARAAWRVGGASYQSANDSRLAFGLGRSDRVEKVEVTWPSGRTEPFEGFTVDSGFLLREGEGRARPLPGFAR